jgi:nucleoid-associated protein YgaU
MKRNESILVYGVTGLLVLILFVAVLFGNERGDALASQSGDGASEPGEASDPALELADLVNADPVAALREAEAKAAAEAAAAEPVQGEPDSSPALAAAGPEPQPAEDGITELAPRVGDYREVTVQRGDTFSLLVQRWCGSLDHLPVVQALNEDVQLDRLRPGRKLLLPWVDEQILDQAARERALAGHRPDLDAAAPEPMVGAAAAELPTAEPAVAPAAVPAEQRYELQKGDSLWKIAVRVTGNQGKAPEFIQRILAANPGLEPERLRVGQSIVLPAR